MSLFCISCGTDHDYDLAPDEGSCIICGDDLIEHEGDLPDAQARVDEVLENVTRRLPVGSVPKPGAN